MPEHLPRYHEAVSYCESLLRPLTGLGRERLNDPVGAAAILRSLRIHFERMGYFLERLGHPEQSYPTVHVAGTSGKGSTVTLTGAVLRAAGLRTGVHTKPYLQAAIERVQVGERYITPDQFADRIDDLRPAIRHMQEASPYGDISYLEISVAQAFLHFASTSVDVAVIETGMGGRFDNTNHLRPLVSVIVTVDYDHIYPLGATLSKIAYHKAGIIKPRTPVVTGALARAARDVVVREATACDAHLYRLGHEIQVRVRHVGEKGSIFDYHSPWGTLRGLDVGLLGAHQVRNAALAVAACELLRQRGYAITEQAIRSGLASARLPGRLEIMQRQPTVLLDSAHNPEKMRSLATALKQIFPQQRPVLVIGVLKAKQVEDIVSEVIPLARTIVVTSPHVLGKPAAAPEELAAICERLGGDVVVEADLPVAVERAKLLAGADGLVCVTGSLYMVGQARGLWVSPDTVLEQCTSFPRVLASETS